MMPKIVGHSKGNKPRIQGSPHQGAPGSGFAIIRTSKKFSEDEHVYKAQLKMQQSHRARKASKPTLPKMPWEA